MQECNAEQMKTTIYKSKLKWNYSCTKKKKKEWRFSNKFKLKILQTWANDNWRRQEHIKSVRQSQMLTGWNKNENFFATQKNKNKMNGKKDLENQVKHIFRQIFVCLFSVNEYTYTHKTKGGKMLRIYK